ncbi:hypothetical protein R3P38DRAFT_2904837 [Favolaschia claudopus]|uniref:HNH nuclease domain-containing protein n=1 Tax=Favolaschia claudopus TaxID=2862362 RepID=A0AAW0CEV8_9AGAR
MSCTGVGGNGQPVKAIHHKRASRNNVVVTHPGYEPPRVMLTLVAFQAPSGIYGVPFHVVLDACCIVAKNREGTLREENSATDISIENTATPILLPGFYTYHVLEGERQYPICTSFNAWSPPRQVPPHWNFPAMGVAADAAEYTSASSDISTKVKMLDGQCALTGHVSRLQNTHLVPVAEIAWWQYREMSLLTHNLLGPDSLPNCLALRADLCGPGMDQGHFVFAPYDGDAVCVCLTPVLADFAMEYHLRALPIPSRIHPMNVYVRFAWGLFKATKLTLDNYARMSSSVTVQEPDLSPFASVKRKRARSDVDGGGHNLGQEQSDADQDRDRNTAASSSAGAIEAPLDLNIWNYDNIKIAEESEAELHRRHLAPYEEEAGMYAGYSKAIRLKLDYMQKHPEVSAVNNARVGRKWEFDDEQAV